ncbi:MAG: protein-L-isoaspartate(D-aspartate) O-methyltransferase [bacterium]|nr:protein-L-isoaspartate(D-aspartate) O-methyltransferase [bacterium]
MNYSEERNSMVDRQLKSRGIKDPLIIDVMGRVPRHEFVPDAQVGSAYYDGPLPIGSGQTISQPYMVAVMTEAMGLKGGDRVLEVGTGSGYQAAVLAEIAGEVYTIERHGELAEAAKNRLLQLGYDNVHVSAGDGTMGLPEKAPFDGIIVTAGAPHVPERLKAQLGEGGRLIIPVGGQYLQSLLRITRKGDDFQQEDLLGCVFVPLIGEDGWKG